MRARKLFEQESLGLGGLAVAKTEARQSQVIESFEGPTQEPWFPSVLGAREGSVRKTEAFLLAGSSSTPGQQGVWLPHRRARES